MTVQEVRSRAIERSIVGTLLCEPERVADVLEVVGPDDFTDRALRAAFQAVVSLDAANVGVDFVAVVEWLSAEQRAMPIPKGGWQPFVVSLAEEAAGGGASVLHWSRMLAEKSTVRAVQEAMRDADRALAGVHVGVATQLADALDEIEGAIHRAAQRRLKGSEIADLCGVVPQLRDQILSGEEPPGLPVYIHELDDLTQGMRGGELTILAARPTVGKTTFAGQVALNVARHGAHVLILSLEMSRLELAERMLANLSGIASDKIRARSLAESQREHLIRGAERLQQLPIAVVEGSATTVSRLRALTRRRKRRNKLDLIVVDYVQLMADPSFRGNRVQEIGAISRGLKALARELDVPVLALSQLSRAGDEGRPRLSHLRESGDLEQDADVVLMLWKTAKDAPLSCSVEKNRHGREGVVRLAHLQESFKVAGLSDDANGGPR